MEKENEDYYVIPKNIHTPPPPHGWEMEIPRGWGGGAKG